MKILVKGFIRHGRPEICWSDNIMDWLNRVQSAPCYDKQNASDNNVSYVTHEPTVAQHRQHNDSTWHNFSVKGLGQNPCLKRNFLEHLGAIL